jgi:hypothetical protein
MGAVRRAAAESGKANRSQLVVDLSRCKAQLWHHTQADTTFCSGLLCRGACFSVLLIYSNLIVGQLFVLACPLTQANNKCLQAT